MGAWGSGSFENDSALDWLTNLAEGGVYLRHTLEAAADADATEYLDLDDAAAAVAAAEIVAAGHSGAADRLNEDARGWLIAQPRTFPNDLLILARRAVERVSTASELQQLWDEVSPANEWRAAIRELLRRLEG